MAEPGQEKAIAKKQGTNRQSEWLERAVNSSMQFQYPGTHEESQNRSQSIPALRDALAANYEYGYDQTRHFPSLGNTLATNIAPELDPATYLASSDFVDGSEAFLKAQADSRRGGDVFSFGDNGMVDSLRDRHASIDALQSTESPSGQIQYEMPSPMDNSSMGPADPGTAAKPKKSASKKKGGRRSTYDASLAGDFC